ncbi:uncharacterized protein LOC127260484 [Andrographis paniculata]|uniref:uncharacterized protein LOC127260484 n=1 Tax=Andrographis paniculata TaxID=175694 RepID=UPI0021E92598|nr:uncharacterized protein LOC127260484 [Andrographis paniculata]
MVRPIPLSTQFQAPFLSSPIPLAIAIFVSISLLVSLCAKHARIQIAKKLSSSSSDDSNKLKAVFGSPKRLVTAISQKAMVPLVLLQQVKKNNSNNKGPNENDGATAGVWRKAILMGEKCQPLDFSGVIFYDYDGNRVSELPKSPCRAAAFAAGSPLRNFDGRSLDTSAVY